MEIDEFEIPVPWGHVAVKTWGKKENTPILAVHGKDDNAGTFDRLIPHLPTSFYYLCIDLPSHGKSSSFPPYTFIAAINNIFTLKLIVDYLNLKKYIIMGHSWGAQIAIFFTQLYPEYVLKLIMLDGFYLYPTSAADVRSLLTEKIEGLIKINENIVKREPPLYTYDEAIDKLMQVRWKGGRLHREAAEVLAKRSLISVEDGKYRFSTDVRLKEYLNPLLNMKFAVDFLHYCPVTCPLLFVYASDTEEEYYYFKPIIEQFKKHAKECIIKRVIGSHDVHNNNPEIVGPIIYKFLSNDTCKL